MFFRPTPSKFDQAKQAAIDAAVAARGAASQVADSAHSLLEHAPHIAANVADVVTTKASEVGGVVSATVDAVRHRGEDAAEAAQDSVEAAQLKAAATRKAAEVAAKEAERAARDAQKKAEAEIDRTEKELARKRAAFEEQQEYIAARAAQLEAARLASQEQAEEIHTRRKAPVTVEVQDDDDEFEYHVVAEKEGGSPLWLLLGGAIVVGAAIVYFFAPKTGRRSRAALKDRLSQVKEGVVDKVTSASDAAAKDGTEITERSEEKLAEVTDSTSGDVRHAIETYADTIPQAESTLQTEEMADEVRVASLDAVDGVAVEADEPLDNIETAATAGSELDGPRHPNIFDKVAEVVGNAADAAEHLAGMDKEEEKSEDETEESAQASSDEGTGDDTEETSASTNGHSSKKKKGK